MLVVLDATVFCADFQMRGNAFRILLGGYRRAGLVPCVPDSVRDEVLNRYREECAGLAAKAERLTRDASRVLGRTIPHGFPADSTLDAFGSEYFVRLLSLVVDHDFDSLPYPKISHKEMVARDLARRRPFRESGTGYRDTLLWSAILEYVAEKREPLALITANTTDFGGGGELHADLRADLEAMNLPAGHVRLFHTLEELNHALIIPTLERLDDIRRKVETGAAPTSVQKWVTDELPMLLWDEEGLGPLEPGHGRCRFSTVKAIRSLRVDAVRQVAPDQILLAATAEIDGIIDVSADWDDYGQYRDVREFFQSDDDEPFSSVSSDLPVHLAVAFSLILRPDTLAVLSSDLDWYETEYVQKVELNPHSEDTFPT